MSAFSRSDCLSDMVCVRISRIEGRTVWLMIKIERLIDYKGVSMVGSCLSCGRASAEDKTLVWITFNPPHSNYHTTICLCRECMSALSAEIRGGR